MKLTVNRSLPGKFLRGLASTVVCFLPLTSTQAVPLFCDLDNSIKGAENTAMNYISQGAGGRQYTTTFKASKMQKLHRTGYREIEVFVKWKDYYYTVYVEVNPMCQSWVTKRTNARP